MNKALLCKWFSRFGVEVDSIWRQMIASKYGVQPDRDRSPVRGPMGPTHGKV